MTTSPIYFLLVDDLEANLLALEALLVRDGLVLLKAKSGEEALELLLEHDVALALLDVQMPNMNGFELAELMRGRDKNRHTPIIFLTAGHGDSQRRFQGYQAGAVDFLQKPIDADILQSKAAIFFDIYAQKSQLQRQHDKLQKLAEENNSLLDISQKHAIALHENDQRKDEFLATLAHELRNPLAPIHNGLQLIRLSEDPSTIHKVCDMMDIQVNNMVRLIDDLLDISRISLGKINLSKDTFTVKKIITSALTVSKLNIDNKNQQLSCDITSDSEYIFGDLTRLSQVLVNLLNNASKYTSKGGQIKLHVFREDSNIVIEVSDNGIGIDAKMLTKVFDIFTQVDFKSHYSQGGLGIGLSLVERIVKMHLGSIEAKSEGLGKGSTFRLCLPLATETAADMSIPPQKSVQDKAKSEALRILIVDDNEEGAKSLAEIMTLQGHTVKVVFTGRNALAIVDDFIPQAIFLDIGLPDIDGYEVCRELRNKSDLQHTLIVAQTGYGQQQDRKDATAAGFDHHLVKPVRLNDINALLKIGRTKHHTA